MKIFIIEDSLDAISLLKVIFKEDNLTIATTGAEATDIIDDGVDFDLVICDHNFPFLRGDRPEGLGRDMLFELVHSGYKGHFLHFSAEPCPEKYELKDNVIFYSLNKSDCLSDKRFLLMEYVEEIKKELNRIS